MLTFTHDEVEQVIDSLATHEHMAPDLGFARELLHIRLQRAMILKENEMLLEMLDRDNCALVG